MNKIVLTITEREQFERAKNRHHRDATLRDIDHASAEWQTHRDRSNMIAMLNRILGEGHGTESIYGEKPTAANSAEPPAVPERPWLGRDEE